MSETNNSVKQRKAPCQECPYRIDLNFRMDEKTIDFVTSVADRHPCHMTPEFRCAGSRIFNGEMPQHPNIPVARTREELIEARV